MPLLWRRMPWWFLSMLVLAFVGCGSEVPPDTEGGAAGQARAESGRGTRPDEDPYSYLDAFRRASAQHHGIIEMLEEVTVRFASAEDGMFERDDDLVTAGVCRKDLLGRREVILNRELWNGSPRGTRELLLFHELGHCVLGLRHDSARGSDGHPMSIMHPRLFDPGHYLAHREEYLSRLFAEGRGETMEIEDFLAQQEAERLLERSGIALTAK